MYFLQVGAGRKEREANEIEVDLWAGFIGVGRAFRRGYPAQAASESFRLCDVDRAGYFKDIDVGPKGFSAGDFSVFRDDFRDPRTGVKAGSGAGSFTIIKKVDGKDALFLLEAVIHTGRGGNLFVEGTGRFGKFDNLVLPVTGGTGIYAQVTGTMKIQESRCDGKDGVTFLFDLFDLTR